MGCFRNEIVVVVFDFGFGFGVWVEYKGWLNWTTLYRAAF